MALDRRERMIENLAVASALGFLTLIVATISLFVDSGVQARERSFLAPAGTSLVLAGRAGDSSFDRVYKTEGGGSYALVINLRSTTAAAIVVARFSPKGEIQELRLLGSCNSRLPTAARELLSSFPGADEVLARAADFARGLAGLPAGGAGEAGS